MSPTLLGGVQNRLAIGDDLEREAKRIEHRSQGQGDLAQEGIFDERSACFGHHRFALSEQRWVTAERPRYGKAYQFVHG
jgi:hypothetical protein